MEAQQLAPQGQFYEEQQQMQDAEEEEQMVSYQTLNVLAEHGIALNDIQKLNDAGIFTVESIAHANFQETCGGEGNQRSEGQQAQRYCKRACPHGIQNGI
jgi:hypothetical protein